MISPDTFLDWLKNQRDTTPDYDRHVVDDLIEQFSKDFDTVDSPVEPAPQGRLKRKGPKLSNNVRSEDASGRGIWVGEDGAE